VGCGSAPRFARGSEIITMSNAVTANHEGIAKENTNRREDGKSLAPEGG